jgi:hypothetical protein
MAKATTQGTCQLCHGTFAKAAMTRHLAKCLENEAAAQPAAGKAKAKKTRLFHLVVQGRYNPQYWLHLEVPATARLRDLDDFLRDLWLECCDHLSAFRIEGTSYSVQPLDDVFAGPFGGGFTELDMNVQVGKVFRPGLTFTYEYDFGSTTELALKVVSEREGEVAKKGAVRLLARNEPPLIPCGKCGQPATLVDTESAWEEEGWLCHRCADVEEDWEEGFLPVVNSPRVGVCGYTGH